MVLRSSGRRNSCGFQIEEELLREVRSCSGNFVLAPAVTRVQVLRSEDFYISMNDLYLVFEEGLLCLKS